MPAQRHPLEEAVRELVANYPAWGPERIRERMERAAERTGIAISDLPHPATIGRIKARMGEAERTPYLLVRFPESFASGALPWESAPTVGEILATMLSKATPERPTVRLALAVWQVSLIAQEGTAMERLIWLGDWLAYAATLPAERAATLRREVEFAALGIDEPSWQELRRAPLHPLAGLHESQGRVTK